MRLFVAINLPALERARLHGAVADLRSGEYPARWVREAQLHLTVKFIGEVPAERAVAVDAAVAKAVAGAASFSLHLGGIGGFPSLRMPRVVWLGAESSPPLLAVYECLERELAEVGVRRENRAFQPHVTLGRARRGARRAQWEGFEGRAAGVDYTADLAVDSIDLMRSELNPRGARYSVIRAHALARGGAGAG